jgi:hypothetical protein
MLANRTYVYYGDGDSLNHCREEKAYLVTRVSPDKTAWIAQYQAPPALQEVLEVKLVTTHICTHSY